MARQAEHAIRVEGLRELRREVRKAGPEAKKSVRKAGREAGNIVRDEARRRVERKSGTLAKTIQTSATETKAEVRAGGKRAPHAGPINFGWSARAMSAALARSASAYWANVGRKGVRGIKGSHFLEEAAHAKWADVRSAYDETIRAVIAALSSDSTHH